jgi:hypothetical protein
LLRLREVVEAKGEAVGANEYLPLKPGTTFVYEGGAERNEMSVTHETKQVMGVECVVVDNRAWEGGQLIERTHDWLA